MSPHEFHRRFESLSQEDRYRPIPLPPEPTSIFVIFKRLTEVRSQIRYFNAKEEHLLKLADYVFEQLKKE